MQQNPDKQPAAVQTDLAGPQLLRILHLSDLHFSSDKAILKSNINLVNNSMLEHIAALAAGIDPFDLAVITGDIAFSGRTEEYRLAGEFCSKLMTASHLDKNSLFVVPGNHDLDRSTIDDLATVIFIT